MAEREPLHRGDGVEGQRQLRVRDGSLPLLQVAVVAREGALGAGVGVGGERPRRIVLAGVARQVAEQTQQLRCRLLLQLVADQPLRHAPPLQRHVHVDDALHPLDRLVQLQRTPRQPQPLEARRHTQLQRPLAHPPALVHVLHADAASSEGVTGVDAVGGCVEKAGEVLELAEGAVDEVVVVEFEQGLEVEGGL